MKDSILLTKSKAFALRVVRLYKFLRDRKESVIAKQMLRSGPSFRPRPSRALRRSRRSC